MFPSPHGFYIHAFSSKYVKMLRNGVNAICTHFRSVSLKYRIMGGVGLSRREGWKMKHEKYRLFNEFKL